MKSIPQVAELASKRLQVFHEKLKGFCTSQTQFEKYVEINMVHITNEGFKKNPQRLALSKQDIAAVIQQGRLNESLSNVNQRSVSLEIAVEGGFKDFEWIDYKAIKSNREPFVQVRVVVRERKSRQLVVTAYVLSPPENREFKEVNREIW